MVGKLPMCGRQFNIPPLVSLIQVQPLIPRPPRQQLTPNLEIGRYGVQTYSESIVNVYILADKCSLLVDSARQFIIRFTYEMLRLHNYTLGMCVWLLLWTTLKGARQ